MRAVTDSSCTSCLIKMVQLTHLYNIKFSTEVITRIYWKDTKETNTIIVMKKQIIFTPAFLTLGLQTCFTTPSDF